MIVSLALLATGTATASAAAARWATEEDHARAALRRRGAASLLARAVLRALLAEVTGRADWSVRVDARGKPWLADGPAVSLSHSGGMVAAAVAESGELGIDIERHRHRDLAALAAAAFGPREQAAVAAGGTAAFFRIWTLREALAKATGAGLAEAADGLDQVADGLAEGCWQAGPWCLAHLRPTADYSLAVALRAPTAQSWGLRRVDLGAG